MTKVLYKDKAGNKLQFDNDNKLSVRNRKGKIVTAKETAKFLKRKSVAKALGVSSIKLVKKKKK